MVNATGKWALVTGASRGIGRLTAAFLAERGCNIIALSRSLEHTASLKAELEAKGVQVFCVAADLADMASVQNALAEIDAAGMNVEIVLNNAGVQIAYRTDYLTTPASDYEASFAINTIAPMMICYHFIPKMIANGFGRIVNTTSGIQNDPQQAGYSASKAALNKVTWDVGTKLQGTDVIISLTDPGWCRTDLGGPHAPNDPTTALPGVVVGAFVDDKKSGRLFAAGDFYNMTLEQAVMKAETMR